MAGWAELVSIATVGSKQTKHDEWITQGSYKMAAKPRPEPPDQERQKVLQSNLFINLSLSPQGFLQWLPGG